MMIKDAAVRYTPLLIVAVGWELLPRMGLISPAILPPMTLIVRDGMTLLTDSTIPFHAAASLSRAFAGFGLAVVFGIAAGILMAFYRPVETVLGPIVQIFYPMPKSALIPVMIIWLGIGAASKIMLIFLGCMPPVTLAAFNGARGVERVYVWSARSLGANDRAVLWDVVIPGAMPQILAGVRTALALCFMLLVGAELIIATEGLGYLIGLLGSNGVYPKMFAVIFLVIGIGFLADRLYLLLVNRALAWLD
jgi:NitT/TauT family transport system permease protein